MNDAEKLLKKPTAEVTEAYEAVRELSLASESMSSIYFPQEDGSTLVIASFRGEEAEAHVFAEGEDTVVRSPALPGGSPEGIQDDGTNTYEVNTARDGGK